MKKFTIVALILSLGLLAVVVPVAVNPNLRHALFRAAGELPGILTYLRLRSPAISRDFETAAHILQGQLDLAKGLSGGNNILLPMLMANTSYIVRQASFSQEAAHMLPYLRNLVAYQPDLLPARVWLASAYLSVEPERALEHAKRGQKIAPNDERFYRIVIDALVRLGRVAEATEQCVQFREAQHLGGGHPYEYNTLFYGTGLKAFGLELQSAAKQGPFVRHRGITIGKNATYSFLAPKPVDIERLVAHMSLGGGFAINISRIDFYHQGKRIHSVSGDKTIMTGRNGFVDGGRYIVTGEDYDALTIHLGLGMTHRVDRVVLMARFDRLGLAPYPVCGN